MINTKRFLGYDKDAYGDLVINQEEAKVVHFIFTEYLTGKGVDRIAKELMKKEIPSVGGNRWHQTTILNMLRRSIKNNGKIGSYYIKGNHSPIVSKDMWDEVQEEITKRAKEKGNVPGDTKKYQNRYPLTGMLYCSKCGFTLIRRTWNSYQAMKHRFIITPTTSKTTLFIKWQEFMQMKGFQGQILKKESSSTR